ncbi:hypothetical protein QCB45_06525 [Thiomicrorhabdus sp. ZW0627]|uniref:hypothetical protein n=1 Tax=Thiomicrorhabdus sp. ZW0627 TaxID=3039774 RepID=UPI002436D60E|nr:hypothetical protein [Thiomicrorhabdus sp. ZW0627]MDG6773980.1 hypothetical protein [Thiomicrorhabdus sp. ZW0627]
MSKKDEYKAMAEAKIEEYTARINELKAKTKFEAAEVKLEMHEQIEKLEAKLDVAKSEFEELSDEAGQTLEDWSDRFEVLGKDLESAFKKFFSKHESK